jgi:hypothetical protein
MKPIRAKAGTKDSEPQRVKGEEVRTVCPGEGWRKDTWILPD